MVAVYQSELTERTEVEEKLHHIHAEMADAKDDTAKV